jgi:hypothetical protein
VGRSFGKYELLEQVAQGGMGVVYRARDTVLGRIVALKMIRSGVLAQPEEVQRFYREAQAAALLHHPHIVTMYEIGEHEGRHYFTMAFAPGGSLARERDGGSADQRRAAAQVEKVAHAVQYAHDRGILHRDLKPANVLLDEHGEPLVGDFGLVKFLHAEGDGLTQTGVVPGTPPYMAPEQAAGRSRDVSVATDVWALGVVLYELLTGQRPFAGGNREEVLHRILTAEPPRPRAWRPDLDPALEAVVLRCLEKDPARRYATAGQLADDLGRWLRGELKPPPEPAQRLPERPRVWGVAALLGLAAVLALAAGVLWPKPPPAEQPGLVLIENGHALRPVRWVVGGPEAVFTETDVGFTLRNPGTCVLELLPAAPWRRYRLEARVRHDDTREGEAGLYFGYAEVQNDRGVYPTLCCASFADRGRLAGHFFFKVSRVEGTPPAFASSFCGLHQFPGAPGAEGGVALWHTLAAEVSPEGVRLYWDGQPAGGRSAEDLQRSADGLCAKTPGARWNFNLQGGVGLFIDVEGTVTFGRVVLTPM